MISAHPPHPEPIIGNDPARARRALDGARACYYERPAAAMAVASGCHELGRACGDAALSARATALQSAVSLHRGDLRGALALIVAAERHCAAGDDLVARSEVAAVRGQVSFFTGSSADALVHAERSIALADEVGQLPLAIYARRTTCLVFGNLEVPDLQTRILALLEMTLEAGDRWEESISRNDLACYLQGVDPAAAAAEIDRALSAAQSLADGNRFALGVIHSTRADIRLESGHPEAALADAERATALLTADGEANPYVLAVTVRAEVQARMALGQLDHARRSGEGALQWLGDRVPQIRSLILSTLAEELRAAGRLEEAYDALARSAELERRSAQELSALRLSLERATIEAQQLREQVDRDWLTGVHNRRYLSRTLGSSAPEHLDVPLGLAALDLDRFKQINDRFGHAVGDQVLIRVARLLCDALREDDIIVRSGGEEFLVLMPSTEARAGAAACERVREAIQRERWDLVADGLEVTASIGLAIAHAPAAIERVVRLADERLYEAKRRGRNRVVGESENRRQYETV